MHGEKEKVNEVIDTLVKTFDQYIKSANDKLKINQLFNEFEDKARNDLMSLVKLSNSRFKSVKCGNTLEHVIEKQHPVYQKIAKVSLHDNFYQTNEIFIQKKKFNNMKTKDKNTQIQELRAIIKDNSKTIGENVVNIYETGGGEKYRLANLRFADKLSKVRSPTMEEINYNIRRDRVVQKDTKTKVNVKNDGPLEELDQNDKNNDPVKLFSDLAVEDKDKFEAQMEVYHQHVDELKSLVDDPDALKPSKKFTFLTDDLKILSYKQSTNNNVVEKKDIDDKVEINKLIRYARQEDKTGRLIKNHMSSLHSTGYSDENIYLPTDQPKVIDKGDVVQLVKNEIINCANIKDLFDKKRAAFNEVMKEYELPKLEDYERLLIRNITTQKISQQTQLVQNKDETRSDSKNKEFPDLLKEKYDNKQVQWKIEDIQSENLEKLERERRKETKHFLNQIKRRPRFAQQFIDIYSQREQTSNNNIINLNKVLGKQFYDKKRLNKKIDEYINDLDRKAKEDIILRKSKKEMPQNLPNEEMKNLIQKHLNYMEDEEPDFVFGEGEVKSMVKSREEISHSAKQKQYYNEYKNFREKVILNEKAKESKDRYSNKKNNLRRNSTIKEISNNNFTRRTSAQILSQLKASSESSKNLSNKFAVFRRVSFKEMPIIQISENKDEAGKKKCQTNTILVNVGGTSKAVEQYSMEESEDESHSEA